MTVVILIIISVLLPIALILMFGFVVLVGGYAILLGALFYFAFDYSTTAMIWGASIGAFAGIVQFYKMATDKSCCDSRAE